jgi:hypothetical protein
MAGRPLQRCPGERLAEGPDRVGVRHRISQPEPEEAHEREPVLDQEFGALVREAMAGLEDQDLEHEHVIERRATAARAVRPRHGSLQVRPEELEVHQPVQPVQRIALGRELLQTLIDVEEPGLPPHPTPPSLTTTMKS